ncbi:SDR family oxidoreductase [Lentzea sp. JNUCC 0626]|uniref:SDR family oxidoreductase n=1 Tax=Lentzea sp. JNUCC 0626 TaxID=3367513 RepID=UPI00374A0675
MAPASSSAREFLPSYGVPGAAGARARRETIVKVSTGLAQRGLPNASVYSSSKCAIESLTRAWTTEFGPSGVRVNTVSPGVIVTLGTDAQEPGVLEIIDSIAADRPGQADEIVSATAFLTTDAAKCVYGAVLPVDGGGLAR